MCTGISMLKRRNKNRQEGKKDRGAALLEFAIALPVFIALLLLVFDAGLGFSAARGSSSAARSAARVGALAGDSRSADFRVLNTLRAHFDVDRIQGDESGAQKIIIYRSDPTSPNGVPAAECFAASSPGRCNTYDASILTNLNATNFGLTVTRPDGTVTCDPGAPDAAWCPLERRADEGDFLGVYVSSIYDAATGLETEAFNIEQRSVFALYFPPLPIELEPAAG